MKWKEPIPSDSGSYNEHLIIITGIYKFILGVAKKMYGWIVDRRLLWW